MSAQVARTLNQCDLERTYPLIPTRVANPSLVKVAFSPARALQQQVETAVLHGFFDKSSQSWRGRHRRAVIVVGTVTGVWGAVFASIWAWVY